MNGLTGIVDAAFDRAKVAILALVVLAFIGFNTYQTAPRESEPDIPLPFVQVLVPLPGISPQDAERLLVRPAEKELQSLEGLVQMDAQALESAASIQLEFEVGLDMDLILTDVRAAVDRAKANFPAAAEEPIVEEVNAQQLVPVMTVILSGSAPERALFRAAKTLETRLTSLPGVLEVTMVGARDEVVDILISPQALDNYGLTPQEVAGAIQRNNALIISGELQFDDGAYTVKVPGLFKSLDDIRQIPLRADPTNLITVGDVADVRRTFEDPEGFARFDGDLAIALDISNRSGANLIGVSEAVKAETLAIASQWPNTIEVAFIGDMSAMVRSIFSSLTASIGLAIILVMIVVVAALGLRSALLVGIAIPSSFLIGLALIGFFGFTLNQLVMFSMVLAVGMLVDGAIVVTELADRRMAEGAGRREAFMDASKRMFWPIIASTATTLAAFVPFLFWNSIEGYFMRWIPITLILVLSAALVVALIFLPIIGANVGIPEGLKRKYRLKGQAEGREKVDLDNIDPTALPGFTGRYARFIDRLTDRPVLVTALAIVGVMTCQKVFTNADVAVEQFLRADSEQVQIYIQGRGNMSPTEILSVASTVEARVSDHPAIEYVYLQTGPNVAQGRDAPSEAIALVYLDLVPYQERDHSLVVLDDLRDMIGVVPGVVVELRQPEQGPPVGKDVQVEIAAANFDDAVAAGILVRQFMEDNVISVDGLEIATYTDVEDNRPTPGIELSMVVDRAEAGRFGATISDVGQTLLLVTDGLIVDTYRPDDSDEEIDVRLRYPVEARTIEELSRITLNTPAGPVPLSNFTEQVAQTKVDKIDRRDSRRIVEIRGNANASVPGHIVNQNQATERMIAWLETGVLADQIGPGVDWRVRGAAESTEESSAFFQGAMVAAMFMIGVILLLQFNSFYHAALTLSAVVLSVFGVLLGIAVTGQYVSVIMTGVGIVALAGIVVNNNIVLIDTYHSLRRAGLDVREAVVRTAAQRLRPVLLTTITTIIGLMPMVFEINIDFGAATVGIGNETSDWWVLLSSAIVYGLAFATLLTLILTPVLLAAPTVIGERIREFLGSLQPRRTIGGRTRGKAGEIDTNAESYRTAAE